MNFSYMYSLLNTFLLKLKNRTYEKFLFIEILFLQQVLSSAIAVTRDM